MLALSLRPGTAGSKIFLMRATPGQNQTSSGKRILLVVASKGHHRTGPVRYIRVV